LKDQPNACIFMDELFNEFYLMGGGNSRIWMNFIFMEQLSTACHTLSLLHCSWLTGRLVCRDIDVHAIF